MQFTGLNELREKFLSFFEDKDHLRMASFPLVPQGDNSLLLINSGMAPMKKYFTGELTPPRKRITTCQKCIRTPDIERVGKTARHGTYFEMLGNFSFGDYFKSEATSWAWEFCTQTLGMPVEKIWISIYQDDEETFKVWTEQVGVDPGKIVRLGKEDNFWEHGTGPCGPCSELYFDRGEEHGCGSPHCAVGCECDRYVEFWNLVFTQFSSDGNGNYTPLANPNIDTGMGLERLACILQGVDNLFEVDTVQNIMKHVSRIAGIRYGEDERRDVSLRVITDHIRSTVFMVSDGVMPSNEGRGYVLRRLLRRAARHGRLLGIQKPFLSEVCDTVIAENRLAYPALAEKSDFIKKLIATEESSFGRTIDQGLTLLNAMIDQRAVSEFSGADAFKLNDTFGFPLDLIKEILQERNITVQEDEYNRLMQEQKERARAARKSATAEAWAGDRSILEDIQPTKFVGYDALQNDECEILAIVQDGNLVNGVTEGDAVLVLDTTPFYAESGGQVGDTGLLTNDGFEFEVISTTKTHAGVFLHQGRLIMGSARVGERVSAVVDQEKRNAIMRNHTAAHLLQAALRKVLGSHVEQAGQLVSAKSVRFDFTHFSAMTSEELAQVELEVNQAILADMTVNMREMNIDKAKEIGAMALFGEKYGDVVRVVSAGDYSIELCGGTHIGNTAKLGLFKIVSEGSVAAGVRRIEGVTGLGVLEQVNTVKAILAQVGGIFKINNLEELLQRAKIIAAELKAKDKEIEVLNSKIAASQIEGLLENVKTVGEIRVISAFVAGAKPESLRAMGEKLKDKAGEDIVVVLATVDEGKGALVAACGKGAIAKKAHAGNIVREVAKRAGGSGGGRPDSAMAGVKDVSKINEALEAVSEIVASMLQ